MYTLLKMGKPKYSAEITEKLIELVRGHAVIYDPSSKDYKDCILITNIWTQISEDLEEYTKHYISTPVSCCWLSSNDFERMGGMSTLNYCLQTN